MSFNPKQVGKVVNFANITTVGANTLTFSAPVENSRAVVFNQTTAGSIPSFPNPTDTSVIFEFAVMNTGSVALGLGNVTGLTSLAAGAAGNVAWNGSSYVNAGGGKSLATIDLAASGTTTLVANSSYHITSWATNAVLTLPSGGTDGDVIQIIDGTTARFPNSIGNVTTAVSGGITWGENTGSSATAATIAVGTLNAVNNFIYDANTQSWASDLINGNRFVSLANFSAAGVIGTAANTVDFPDVIIAIAQTTANVALTLPNPTLSAVARRATVLNTGTVPLSVNGVTIAVASAFQFHWFPASNAWFGLGASSVATSANYLSIQNSNAGFNATSSSATDPTVVFPTANRLPFISTSGYTATGNMTTSSANNTITIPATGIYEFNCSGFVAVASTQGTRDYTQLVKNSATVLTVAHTITEIANDAYEPFSFTWVGSLNAGDVIDVRCGNTGSQSTTNYLQFAMSVIQIGGFVASPIGVKITQLLANVPGTSVTGSASPGSQVAAWSAAYTAAGGTVEVQASFDVIGTAGGIVTAYLWRNGVVIATDTQAVVQGTGSGSTFQNMNLISAVLPNETGTNTYAISLGTGAALNSNGYCNMVVREYGAGLLAQNVSAFTGATSSTAGALGTVPAPASGQQDYSLFGDGTWGGQDRLPYLFIASISASGAIGTAAATVDSFAFAEIQQATAGLTLTLPNPTVTSRAIRFLLRNAGTVSFLTNNGVIVGPTCSVEMEWDVAVSAWRLVNNAFENGNQVALTLSNLTANGALTTAANMETYGVLLLPQTTAGITATLPAVSVTPSGTVKFTEIINTGSQSITVAGVSIAAGSAVVYYTNGTAWQAITQSSTLPQVLVLNNSVTSGTLGGVTFSLTITDPLTLTTSVGMYGTVQATIVQFAAGSNWDYWDSGTSGTSDVIHRGQSWSNNTSGKIGISSASYSGTGIGTLSTAASGGTTFTITSSFSGVNVTVVITRVQ